MDPHATEVAAMSKSAGAIEPLPEAGRRRVVKWLAELFDVQLDLATETASAPAAASKRKRRSTAMPRTAGSAAPSTPRTGKTKSIGTFDKTLNLRPKGVQSFKDFAAEKMPSSNFERNAVAVYYLERIAGQGNATVSRVYAAYKEVGWRLPFNQANSLQVTGSQKGWIDSADSDDLKVTPSGENLVEQDLPRPTKK